MIENGKYSGFDENIKSQLNESSKTLIGAPITTGLDTAYAINAPEINWAGYKLYDEDLTSTGHMLSYIETQLDSKATSSGEIWDEIKDNEYITSQINIYASYTSNKIAPDIVWVNPTDNDVNTYSSLPSSSSDAEGWYTSTDIIPGTNKYVWMSSIYIVKSLSNNIFGYRGPSSTPIYLPSESGINGNFKSTVFCRTNETPKAPIDGAVYNTGVPTIPQVYKASNNEQITGVEWSDGIPSGQEILWASTGIIKDSSPETTVWTTPRQMTDTATYDVEFAKKQTNDATPATPNDSNRHGSDAQIWFDPTKDASQDFTQMYWRAERECINGEWGDWVIVRIKGEQGTAGIKGDFKSTVFKRSENQPEAPSGGDYDHPVPSGWYDGIPNGTGPVWSTWKTFSANDNNSSWTTPALVADTPTYDVEFSPYSNNNNTSPRTTENIDTSNDWFDPTKDALPENITWENMIWRAERNRATSQDAWSTWVITKIKGEDGHVNLDMPYYEQRWRTFENTASVPSSWDNSNLPYKDNSYINVDDSNGWTLVPNYSSGGIVYMTSCKVIIDVIDNAQTKRYNGDWPTPIRVTGIDGKANPIQPVLKYQWYNTNEYSNVPSCSINSEDPGNSWLESPGNPSGENKYLWMIQGQRQDNSMQTIDGTNYWTSPVCLSGADGEPGVDGDDIEFIYHIYNTVQVFGDSNDNPSHWEVSSQDNYLGPDGYKWTNHPTGVTLLNKYEYCSYRRKTGITGNKQWTTFSAPFAWSIYGENGLDGDGVEYIYAVTATDTAPTQPKINSDNYTASQQSEWGVDNSTWFDDPQLVNNSSQKFQWVSTRKYRYPKSGETTLGDNTLDPNKKYWFNYSNPQLWNWYVNNGTNADKYVMIFTRTGSSETVPTSPNTNLTVWSESPGNNTSSTDDEFLWMSAQYIEYNKTYNTTTRKNWSTPVCLTGESGRDGEDGADIEFIYYRTADDNKTFGDDWNNFDGDSSENGWPFNTSTDNVNEIDEIKYYDPNGDFNEAPSSDVLHDVWTDNPLGVTSTYDYEYAAVRRKPAGSNSAWGDFSKPFLWSKYGEDGVDGDGVEYIFYRTEGTTAADFTNAGKNPKNWLHNEGYQTTSEYRRTKPVNETAWWADDPSGVGKDNKYEYVSTRKKISKQNYFKLVKNWLNPLAKQSISDLANYNDWISIYNDGEYNSSEYSTWKIQLIDNDIASWTNENELNAIYNLLTNKQQKVWGPYSEPTLWSNFAEDALATNLVLESDNDNVTVSVTSEGTVNNNYTDSANFTLVYNTKPLNLGTDYTLKILTEPTPSSGNNYNPFGTKTDTTIPFNTDLFKGNFASLTENTLTVNIPEGFDISKYDYIMSITLEAKIIRNDIAGLEINTPVIFTLKISGVELSINDIYKLNIDRQVIKLNSNNTYDTINISLKSLTSNNSITSQQDAASKHLYIRYNVDERNNVDKDAHLIDINNECISVGQFNPSAYYNKHTFRLYYILDDSFLNNDVLLSDRLTDTVLNEHNAVLLDTETITAVYDGAKGDTGDKGSDAVALDWTNDQINLAVDENGLILPNQRKSTVLSTNNENILISAVIDNFSTKFTTSQQFHSNTQTISKPTKNYSFGIEIQNDYVKNSSNVISENGIEVTFTVTLNNGNTITKDLRICGQHNGKNGENAVTYEILSSANSATKNTTDVITPSAITLSALKYSGTDITTLTTLPEYLKFTYVFCNETNMSDEFNVDNTYTFNLISAVYKNNGQELNPILQNGGTDKSADNSAVLNNAVTNNTSVTTEHTGTQTGTQTTGISSGIGTGGEYSPIQGTDYLFKVSYANVYLSYQYNSEWKHIDMETIPIIDQGEKGAQGFNGAIVRMRGEYVHSAAIQYGNGEYNRSTTGAQYNGVSPLYIDIVTYTNNNGTKYYTPKTGVTGSYMSNDSSYLCKGSQYVSNTYPTQPDGSINSKWKAATQFDFVATKLLYADQALINQISSHDFIATTEDGTPVAGMTSGKKDYGNNGKSLSLLNNANGGNIDTGGNDTDTLEDTSHVRMFAGQIWKKDGGSTSYSLTYAPFNVRQDGTAYMSKAHVEGDITANTLTLGDGSFKHLNLDNTLYTLPSVYDNSTRSFYILCDADNCTLTCESPMKLRVSVGESKKLIGNTILLLSKSTFYQCISIKENDTNYWNIIATKISEDTGTEYKYIDITDDVQLIGYKYLSDNSANNVILSSIDTYDTEHPCGPLITNNTTNGTIDIEFFTYLDPTLYGNGTIDNVALADFGEFIWLNM